MDETSSAARAVRPDAKIVAGEVRRNCVQTAKDLENAYAGISAIVQKIAADYFIKDRRMPIKELQRLPGRINKLFAVQGSPLPQIVVTDHTSRRTNLCQIWLQPNLQDAGEAIPISRDGEEFGAVQGTMLSAMVFCATRRKIFWIDREPGFMTIQRHAYTRYATRRREPPEHVISSLAMELLLRSPMIAAAMVAHFVMASRGVSTRLVVPLDDGLALGHFASIVFDPAIASPEPFGAMMSADRGGTRLLPLEPHVMMFRPNPGRCMNALIRTVIHEDMLREDQEVVWRSLQVIERKHRPLMGSFFKAIWLYDLVEEWDGDGMADASHILNPEHYKPLLDDLIELYSSPAGMAVVKDDD